ncbi:glycosyltransferase family 4 protein [Croceibacterium ferulae]|uniref:glycosyltransferase family 4 protein n=1 Tax=Croceibacterium ferulae TaxID=1854641 RepID=UPI000EAFD163|nr:glycosyltransferase family 1 protein [Croceibacterium ferulae]
MRLALVTDAWAPQVNGVVRTLAAVTAQLRSRGHEVGVISPDMFRSLPCPTYPEIRLAMTGAGRVGRLLDEFAPDALHLSTEGPLGWAARGWSVRRGRAFTTAYHTQFPDYLARRTGLDPRLFWPYIRHFHRPAAGIMVATGTIRDQLQAQGLTQVRPWGRGVDLAAFGPDVAPPDLFFDLPRPIQLYVGRVAPEKNVEAFLANTHGGSKVVVGDGPALARLQAQFPQALFLGRQSGAALAACYAGADVLVFPSRTDTFGLVMIEALACGTPVAAYPVAGPLDVLTPASGAMADRLEDAIAGAVRLDRGDCLAHGRSFTWAASADQFLHALEPAGALRDGNKRPAFA